MSRIDMSQTAESKDPRWKDLYRIGGISALVIEFLILFSIIAFVLWPYLPGSASTEDILVNIYRDRFGGLMALDFLLLISNLCGILLFLALYVALKRVNESYALIALVLGLVASVLIVPARPIAELFIVSEKYASAATNAARSQYLAAGEALLALFDGTSLQVNTFLGGLALLISSILMLRSKIFSKYTAYVGIFTNVAVCGFFLPGVGTYLLFLSLLGYLIWNIQLARTFFKLTRNPMTTLNNVQEKAD